MRAWFDTEVAKEIGLNEAILLNYFTYWTLANEKSGKFVVDGVAYVRVSYPELCKIFCCWCERTIRETIMSLLHRGYVRIEHHGNGMDRTNWYTVTESARKLMHMDEIFSKSPSGRNCTMVGQDLHDDSAESARCIVQDLQNLQYTKEREKRKSKRKTTARAKLATPFENPSPKLLEAWEGFVEHRKAIRAPLTPRAVTLTANELERLAPGNDDKKAAILDQSVERGWRGVFPLKDNTNQRHGGNVHREQTVEEMYAEAQEILKNGGGII